MATVALGSGNSVAAERTDNGLNEDGPGVHRQFVTTHWSLILAARRDGPEGEAALNELCRSYWPPLFVYARRDGLGPHDAQDAVQSFIAMLLERRDLSSVLPEKGRFRSFLLAAFKNFLVSRARGEVALKRGGGVELLRIDADAMESMWARELMDESSPDRAFDRGWARNLMARALENLRSEHKTPSQARIFNVLQPALVDGGRVHGEAAIAAELGITPGALAVAATRLRRRYRALIEHEVRRTLADPADLEEEMRAMWQAWS